MPASSNWSPRFAVFGDMGNVNAQSVGRLQEETQAGHFDAVLHVGRSTFYIKEQNMTVTTESCKKWWNNIVSYEFLWIRRTYDYCKVFSNRVRVRIRFCVWLVSGYAVIFVLLSVVIVIPPLKTDTLVNIASSSLPKHVSGAEWQNFLFSAPLHLWDSNSVLCSRSNDLPLMLGWCSSWYFNTF